MQRRKITFKLYPTASQEEALQSFRRLHCELYNAALQERRDAWRIAQKSISYIDQQNTLPAIKKDRPDLVALGSHALQETLRRVDRAYQAFYRRCKAGQIPGHPRFKPIRRFPGFCYPDPAGWAVRFEERRTARIRIGKLGWIRARTKHRFDEIEPNDLTLSYRMGAWYASMTVRVSDEACARDRTEDQERGFDLGTLTLMTFDDGEEIANPRWLRESLNRLKTLQRARAKKRIGSSRYRALSWQIAKLHEAVAAKRKDFLHKLTTKMAKASALLATEKLQPKNMSRKGGKRKKGLNRELLSAGFGLAHQMLAYKVVETGTHWHVAETRSLKPTQRCSGCWQARPKDLDERWHDCPCGTTMSRDQNSALVCLIDALRQITNTPGAGVAAREEPLDSLLSKFRLMTRETPTKAAA